MTTIGGLLPDLDSNSGVPVREMFGPAAVRSRCCSVRPAAQRTVDRRQILVFLGGVYLFIRFGLSRVFKHLTVHRGMFHSIPGVLIAGLVVYLTYHQPVLRTRFFLAFGVMIGFRSLVLDEIYSVDFHGVTIKLNKYGAVPRSCIRRR